jgi:hypothetical protein
MLSKVTMVVAGLCTFAVASPLPGTVIISVIESSTGTLLGSLNGYGNFASPGPDFPFRTFATTGGFSTLSGYSPCTVAAGVLDCSGATSGAAASFDVSLAVIFSAAMGKS